MAATSIANKVKSGSLLVGNAFYTPPIIAFESIQTQTLGSNQTSITFTSIPSIYTHLQVRYTGRKTTTGIADLVLTFNGDGNGANYTKGWAFSYDGGGPYVSRANTGALSVGYLYGDDSNVMGSGIIDINNYKSTTNNKTVRYLTGNEKSSTGNATLIAGSGTWYSTSAISSITLTCSTIQAGSTFALYGIEG